MIKKFETGKMYRYIGKTRGRGWNDVGEMDYVLDGNPRLCTYGNGTSAMFEGDPTSTRRIGWDWSSNFENWFEAQDEIMVIKKDGTFSFKKKEKEER